MQMLLNIRCVMDCSGCQLPVWRPWVSPLGGFWGPWFWRWFCAASGLFRVFWGWLLARLGCEALGLFWWGAFGAPVVCAGFARPRAFFCCFSGCQAEPAGPVNPSLSLRERGCGRSELILTYCDDVLMHSKRCSIRRISALQLSINKASSVHWRRVQSWRISLRM